MFIYSHNSQVERRLSPKVSFVVLHDRQVPHGVAPPRVSKCPPHAKPTSNVLSFERGSSKAVDNRSSICHEPLIELVEIRYRFITIINEPGCIQVFDAGCSVAIEPVEAHDHAVEWIRKTYLKALLWITGISSRTPAECRARPLIRPHIGWRLAQLSIALDDFWRDDSIWQGYPPFDSSSGRPRSISATDVIDSNVVVVFTSFVSIASLPVPISAPSLGSYAINSGCSTTIRSPFSRLISKGENGDLFCK